MYECVQEEWLNNSDKLVEIAKQAISLSKCRLVNGIQAHQHNPEGITIIATLEQSSLTMHTWPELKQLRVTFDVCGAEAQPEKGVRFFVDVFKPKEHNALKISRGNVSHVEISPLIKRRKAKIFGYELCLDLYGIESKRALNDIGYVYNALEQLVKDIGMELQAPPFIFRTDEKRFPTKAGLSGWVPLAESGISIHTMIKEKFISLDIFSCKKFNPYEVTEVVKKAFKPQYVDDQYLVRGINFPS